MPTRMARRFRRQRRKRGCRRRRRRIERATRRRAECRVFELIGLKRHRLFGSKLSAKFEKKKTVIFCLTVAAVNRSPVPPLNLADLDRRDHRRRGRSRVRRTHREHRSRPSSARASLSSAARYISIHEFAQIQRRARSLPPSARLRFDEPDSAVVDLSSVSAALSARSTAVASTSTAHAHAHRVGRDRDSLNSARSGRRRRHSHSRTPRSRSSSRRSLANTNKPNTKAKPTKIAVAVIDFALEQGLNATDDGLSLSSPRAVAVEPADKENLIAPVDSRKGWFKSVFGAAAAAPSPPAVDFFAFQRAEAVRRGVVFTPAAAPAKPQPQQTKTTHLRHWR
jgi:hypothetical protein